ncbi:hypothetical protein ASD12_32540 [Mesorhizobium sp. Root102]|uniref:hypothetical protein n=1 Tax=Mesorhizobium sp. Root102 TaxID=1736422 RepID=UPI0007128A13|nr:hypothetical protein [Mesorhizobium sp. Root102]KQU80511.1 hypothetical protein ASD12_32540 [Mesorhizobium sp. Root102]
MEHFDIEDAFKRASVPDLALRAMFRRYSSSGPQAQFQLELWLENVGEATAFFPSVHLYQEATFDSGWPNHDLGGHRERMPDGQMSFGNSEFVIHPGQIRQIEKLEMHFVFDNSKSLVELVFCLPVAAASLIVQYSIFAKGMRRKAGEIVLRTPDFLQVEWDGVARRP